MYTQAEENYLKALFSITLEVGNEEGVGTNELADYLKLTPPTVNNMLKKLKTKELVNYEKYGKITLSDSGRAHAVYVIRKHRLWETFLCKKLDFNWNAVHEIAEQLEHIDSPELIDRLDKFLDYPSFDPHGDPIPDAKGKIKTGSRKLLSELKPGAQCRLVAVKDDSTAFLDYVNRLGLKINSLIEVVDTVDYDHSMHIVVDGGSHTVSKKFTDSIQVLAV